MPKDTPKPKRAKAPDAELDALAQHLAEALRVTRMCPDIPAQLYNDIAGAFTGFQRRTPNEHLASHAEEIIKRCLIVGIEAGCVIKFFRVWGFKRLSRAAGF